MPANSEKYKQLWTHAERLSTVGDAQLFFEELASSLAAHELTENDGIALRLSAFEGLMEATRHEPGVATEIITRHLVPESVLERGEGVQAVFRHERLRDLLHDWIEQYPDELRFQLRRNVLRTLLDKCDEQASEAVLLSMASIGFPDAEVIKAFRSLSARDDEIGNAAIRSWTSMRPAGKDRDWLVSRVLAISGSSAPHKLDYAIQELADPVFIPGLAERILNGDALAGSLLSRIADSRPGDLSLQEKIWSIVSEAAATNPEMKIHVFLGGDVTNRCDCGGVIHSLLSWLGTSTERRYIIYHRLEECVRPHQLTAWGTYSYDKALISTIRADAIRPTGPPTRMMTTEQRVKKAAWQTALCSGIEDATSWLGDAVATEDNANAQHMVMDFAACLAISEIPGVIKELVEDRFDWSAGIDDQRF